MAKAKAAKATAHTAHTVRIGESVPYTLSAENIEAIARQRYTTQVEGDVVPLTIQALVAGPAVNGQLLLDGGDTLWVIGVVAGTGPGTWSK